MRLEGLIERRLLVNYRVDPDALGGLLPVGMRPHLVDGAAVAGICLIRMADLRPKGLPAALGVRSESAAHRIAVEWDTPAGPRTGVWIPRRDTGSLLNALLGGWAFPGAHHRARFTVQETDERVQVAFEARDGSATADVAVRVREELAGSRLFADVEAASRFFEAGAVGWSPRDRRGGLDGLTLRTDAWRVEPAEVEHARSSVFDDPRRFPAGSAVLDCALLMRQVPVRWEPVTAGPSRSAPAEPAA